MLYACPEININWRVEYEFNFNDKAVIWIETNQASNYRVLAEIFKQERSNGLLGWFMRDILNGNEVPETLKEKMRTNGCTTLPRSQWLAYRICKGSIAFSDKEGIIACHEDNQNNLHPIATKVAGEIWKMFTGYRVDIENLPNFIQ